MGGNKLVVIRSFTLEEAQLRATDTQRVLSVVNAAVHWVLQLTIVGVLGVVGFRLLGAV